MSGTILPVQPDIPSAQPAPPGVIRRPDIRPGAISSSAVHGHLYAKAATPKPEASSAVGPAPAASPELVRANRSRLKPRLLAGVAGFAFVLMAAQLLASAAFGGRFMPGVAVAGVPIGGLTRPEAQKLLTQKLDGYKLRFDVGSKHYTLTPEQAGVDYDVAATLDQAYVVGRNHFFLPLGLLDTYSGRSLAYAFSVNQPVQAALVQQIVTESGQAPVDATVVVQKGVPSVQPDKDGHALSAEQLKATLNTEISTLATTPAELTPAVQQAHIKAADVAPAIEQTKQLLAVPVKITYQGRTFTPSAADMDDWFAFDKSPPDEKPALTPKVSLDGIKHYLQTVSKSINVNPTNRKVNVENGNSSEVQAGKDGIQLDQDALAEQIAKAVGAKQAFVGEAPTKPVPFQTEYNRTVSLDYGKYIEVNLASQHLWVYQDHQVIFDSPVTSGATGAGFPTVEGLFSVQAKQTNRNLNGYAIGYNYNVFVKYWMPFYGNYGLHDASWRSSFGGQDYYYGGSHGCINLPDATAAFLFGWADVGTPVWVHH